MTRYLPCTRCGDDTTFAAKVAPPVACHGCGWFFAVVVTAGAFALFSGFPGRNRRWWHRSPDKGDAIKIVRRRRRSR